MRVFLDCRQTVTPNKTESTEVISLLSISLTPSRSERCRRSGAFTVIQQKTQRSEGELEFDGQCDEGAQLGAPNGDVHLSFYATYSHSEHSRREEGGIPDKGKRRKLAAWRCRLCFNLARPSCGWACVDIINLFWLHSYGLTYPLHPRKVEVMYGTQLCTKNGNGMKCKEAWSSIDIAWQYK